MSRLIAVLFLLLFAVSGCSVFDLFTVSVPAQNLHITMDGFDAVIFEAANSAQAGLGYAFNDPIIDYWTPTEAQVMALEAGLVPFLESEVSADYYRYGFWEDLPTYKRQYFGITFNQGQPLILANYFCVDQFEYWLDTYVMVMDGGDCFFHLLYDPTSASYSDLRINGEA
jgi:hypothetical protein